MQNKKNIEHQLIVYVFLLQTYNKTMSKQYNTEQGWQIIIDDSPLKLA